MAITKKQVDSEYVRMYYEHQYERIEKDVNQRLSMQNFMLTLSALAFTFGYQNNSNLTIMNGLGLPVIIIAANTTALLNIKYTTQYIDVHRERAHEALKRYASELIEIDVKHNFDAHLLKHSRNVEKALHQMLIVIAFVPLSTFLFQIF